MKSVSLYQPKQTYIHQRVDPFTKLIYLLCSLIVSFAIPTLLGEVILIAINVGILIWAKELRRAAKAVFGSLVVILTVFIIQGLFNPNNHTLLLQIGPIHFYREGLLFALTITLRVVNIISASSVLTMTTSPTSVVESCVRRGLSAKAGYVVTAIIQIIPTMLNRATTIREAQQSRGLVLEGNLLHRIRNFVPLMGPVIMSSLMSIQERAMALEVRGFSVKTNKTFFNEDIVLPGMALVRLLIGAFTVLIVVWGVIV